MRRHVELRAIGLTGRKEGGGGVAAILIVSFEALRSLLPL